MRLSWNEVRVRAASFAKEWAPGATVHVHAVGAPHMADPSRLLASAGRIYGDRMEELWGEFLPVPRAPPTSAGPVSRPATRIAPKPSPSGSRRAAAPPPGRSCPPVRDGVRLQGFVAGGWPGTGGKGRSRTPGGVIATSVRSLPGPGHPVDTDIADLGLVHSRCQHGSIPEGRYL